MIFSKIEKLSFIISILSLLATGLTAINPSFGWPTIAISVAFTGLFLIVQYNQRVKKFDGRKTMLVISMTGMFLSLILFFSFASFHFWMIYSLSPKGPNGDTVKNTMSHHSVNSINNDQNKSPALDSAPTYFRLNGDSTLDVDDMKARGDTVNILQSNGNSKITMRKLDITGPNAGPYIVPEPSTQAVNMTYTEVKNVISDIQGQLLKLQKNFDAIDHRRDDIFNKYQLNKEDRQRYMEELIERQSQVADDIDRIFTSSIKPKCLEVMGVIIQKTGIHTLPEPNIVDGYDKYRQARDVQIGFASIRSGFVGYRIHSVIAYLDHLKSLLNN